MPNKKTTAAMTDRHKKALADGRKHAKNVRDYLEALKAANAPKKKGRKRTPESINSRLQAIEEQLATADTSPLTEVQLVQERLNLNEELAQITSATEANPQDYEAGFIQSVASYSESKGITYAAWRELGVPAPVLRSGGVSR